MNAIPRLLGPFLGISLFLAALWILHHSLAQYNYQDILAYLGQLSKGQLLLAVLSTGLSYLTMTGYDLLAMHYIRRSLPWIKVGFAAFVSYAFSNTVGLSLLTSGSVRYRLYSSWGLTTVEITKVVIFTALTLWLGILTIGGGILAFAPVLLPPQLPLPFASSKALGLTMLTIPVGYLLLGMLRRQPIRVWRWELPMVRPRLALLQLLLGILDWAIASSVLYVLLPSAETLGYGHFLGVFLVAQTAGLLSHVPGGLGIFESLILLLLSPHIAIANLIGALVAYRLIYYLLPLALATVGLGIHEGRRHTQRVLWLPRVVGPWIPVLLPQAITPMALVSGALLLFSAVSPAATDRVVGLPNIGSLWVLELSHFLSAVAGTAILLLARGLQRRLQAAWRLTVMLLVAGIASSVLSSFALEEAVVLGVTLAGLWPCRRDFYRQTKLLDEPLNLGWIAILSLVLLCTLWLGLFTYKDLEYSDELWWHFSAGEQGDAPRSLRAMLSAVAVALLFAAAKRLRPTAFRVALLDDDASALRKAGEIIASCESPSPLFTPTDGKALLFNRSGTAFILYGMADRTWAALGDPVAPSDEERQELAWEFCELCEQHNSYTAFYGVHAEQLGLYVELGLTLLKIGEEGRVLLADFSPGQWMHDTLVRLTRKGYRFEVIAADKVPALLPRLRLISHSRARREVPPPEAACPGLSSVAVVCQGEDIRAYATLWAGGRKSELAVDLMGHLFDGPSGLIDYVLIQIMLWGKGQGYTWLNLGIVPSPGLPNRSLAPLWQTFATAVAGQYDALDLRRLRQFRDKFNPQWAPRYLAAPGGIALSQVLSDLAVLLGRHDLKG